jgi:hypothetical protein
MITVMVSTEDGHAIGRACVVVHVSRWLVDGYIVEFIEWGGLFIFIRSYSSLHMTLPNLVLCFILSSNFKLQFLCEFLMDLPEI